MIGPGELYGTPPPVGIIPFAEHRDPFHVDGFAGGGGASVGYEIGTRRRVHVAINHCPEALRMHRANHRRTRHYREDIRALDPVTLCDGRQPRSAWFSPDCKDFSKAKGGKPKSKRIRGLAWVVLHWVNTVRPLTLFMENVEEFQDWSPLLPDGRRNPWRRGWFFRCFVGALRRRGYVVEWRELRACDYGAPTIRKRFILCARCDGGAIHWPAPTHGPRDSEAVRTGRVAPYVAAADVLDLSLPCPSIFLTPGEARDLGVKRPLADATLRRIAKGVDRYVLHAKQPFFFAYGQQGGAVRDPRDPLHTVTASPKDTNTIVACHLARCAHGERDRNGKKRGRGAQSIREPHPTICTTRDTAVVAAFLAQHNTGVIGHDLRKPVSTITGRGTQQQVVGATLFKYYGQDGDPRLDEPLHTITTKDRFGLAFAEGTPVPILTPDLERRARRVAKFLRSYGVEFEGEFATVAGFVIVDLGMRMLTARELFRAQGFGDDYNIGDDPATGLTLSKTAQVRMCGNSVPPPLAAAMVRANLPDLVPVDVAA